MKIKEYVKKHKYILSLSFFLICFSLFMMILFVKESDYFWHIKAGEYMFNNNTILTKDVFSWFMNGKYWMSHEWGFDYLIYILKQVFGIMHLFIYPFVCVLGLLLILFFTNKKGYLMNIIFTLFWVLVFLMFCVYIQARPHLLSFIFLALTIYLTYDLFKNKNSKKIYFLPVITLFWTNFHGGSSNLSYLFCMLFLIIGLFEFKFTKIEAEKISKKQICKYLIVAGLCALAICVNPHGIKMLSYPYSNIIDTVMIDFIAEWQPTVLGNVSHLPFFVLIVILMFILLISKKKIQFIDLALFGVSIVLGLKSIRFWGYTYIIMSYVVYNYIPERKPDKGICRMLLTLSMLFLIVFSLSIPKIFKEYKKTFISNKMVDVIKKEAPTRLYNMYDFGGELIYNDVEVFVDGRADLYSRNNLSDYNYISLLRGDYVKLIDKYNFDYFLVSTRYPINTYLSYNNDYMAVYAEEEMILYKKVNFDI